MSSLNWAALKKAIADTIKTNSNQEITADVLQGTLMSMIQSLGENATFAGVATPNVNLGLPGGPTFYLAATAGTYSNGLTLGDGEIAALVYSDGAWRKEILTNVADLKEIYKGNLGDFSDILTENFAAELLRRIMAMPNSTSAFGRYTFTIEARPTEKFLEVLYAKCGSQQTLTVWGGLKPEALNTKGRTLSGSTTLTFYHAVTYSFGNNEGWTLASAIIEDDYLDWEEYIETEEVGEIGLYQLYSANQILKIIKSLKAKLNALQALDVTALFTAGGSVSGVTAQKLLTAPLYVKSYIFNSSVRVSVTDQKWFFSAEIIRQTTSGDITRVTRVAVANLNNDIITSESVKDI